MYDTGGSHSVCQLDAPDGDIARRLSWLSFELSPDAERRRLTSEREQGRALSMLRPRSTEDAYRWLGTFLGLLPPLALFGGFILRSGAYREGVWVVALCAAMNAVCCLVGRRFGAFLGRRFGDPRSRSWPASVFVSLLYGLFWGVVTGAAGGAVAFLVGALPGVAVAVPVALAAFPAFALLHRLLSHGGMIEGRQLWPLVFGVPLTIAALMLSPWIK